MSPALAGTADQRASALLRDGKKLVDAGLRVALARLPAPTRRVAHYHLGWADPDGGPACREAGKGLRGALVLTSARAAGGTADDAIEPAVAVELVHNFSMLHDDVMDRDALRRGATAAWAVFGESAAVLAGDALLALAFTVLADTRRPERTAAHVAELCRATVGLVAGQDADLAFEGRRDVRPDECLAMAGAKTGALIAASSAMGAIAAGASPATVDVLRGYGRHLGVAFQIADDLLGLHGDPATTGKPVGADVRRRKKTLPAVVAMAGDGPAARRLADIYRCDRALSAAEVDEATCLIEDAGGVRAAAEEMRRQRDHAVGALASVPLAPDAVDDLVAVAELATDRVH